MRLSAASAKQESEVRKFKEGDLAAVGCLVDSCRKCESCKAGLENYCEVGPLSLTTVPTRTWAA